MPVLQALKAFTFGEPPNRAKLKPGDLFKCKERYVAILIRQGVAKVPDSFVHTPSGVAPQPTYSTRAMEADKPKTVSELRSEAEAKGIHLPSGYVTKSELMDILARES